jgi:hypothetical protein
MAKATDRDRTHFARIAKASAAIEREREREAAFESPAAKIEQALRLSNALLRSAPRDAEAATEQASEPQRVSLSARWRRLRGEHT